MSEDISDIPASRIANWEKWGVDAIRADLETGGIRYVGGTQEVQKQAWRWVRYKEAEAKKAEAEAKAKKPEEVLGIKPSFGGVSFDVKAFIRNIKRWFRG